ncbi:MAG: hypothetical protein FWF65_09305 [Bacteroidetes bacterium]|nr:hypothetical protein [Bacteroidota bacterium]
MINSIPTIGALCISSVCYRETGFMDYRFTAYKAASELGFGVIRNPEDTGITQSSFNSALKQINPVFVLIVGSEESEKVVDECKLALENGLPIFVFIKTERDKQITESADKIMKGVSQTTYNGDCTLFSSCEELYETLQARLNDFIKAKMTLRLDIQDNRGSTYFYAYEQIKRAKKRIILSQKTSLLLLGPRKGNTYEYRAYDALLEWIRNKDKDMQFMHLFCLEDTVKDLSSGEYDITTAKKTLIELLTVEKSRNHNAENPNCTFRAIKGTGTVSSIAHLITDTGIQLVLPIAGNTFNLVLPYYFATEAELMKLITHLHTQKYMSYEDIQKIYDSR